MIGGTGKRVFSLLKSRGIDCGGGISFGGGSRQTGVFQYTRQMSYLQGDGQIIWEKTESEAQGESEANPIIADETIYLGTGGGYNTDKERYTPSLSALDLSDGSVKWRKRGGLTEGEGEFQAVYSTPLLSDDVLYVIQIHGEITALDPSDGSEIWSYQHGNQIRASPSLSSDALYVGDRQGNLIAVNRADGSKLWTFSKPGSVTGVDRGGDTVHSNGVVYMGYADNMYAVDASTGSELWSHPTVGSYSYEYILSAPVLIEDSLYFSTYQGDLYALDISGGSPTQKWMTSYDDTGNYATPAYADGSLYVAADSGFLYEYDAQDGSLVSSTDTGRFTPESPSVTEERVFFAMENYLYAVNRDSKQIEWSHRMGDRTSQSATFTTGGDVVWNVAERNGRYPES